MPKNEMFSIQALARLQNVRRYAGCNAAPGNHLVNVFVF